MKKNLAILVILIALFTNIYKVNSQSLSKNSAITSDQRDSVRFSDYFIDKILRVDFVMAGNHTSEKVYLESIKQEPSWAGPHKNLIDPYNLGAFRIMMMDSASGKKIFSRGFCNVFQEWQGTAEALKVDRSYPQSAILPYPVKTVIFRIDKRSHENGKFSKLFEMYINPKDYFIIRENPRPVPYVKFKDSGSPENKVDIAFIAEGYTQKEMTKFLADAKHIGDYILASKPYSQYQDRFNFYAVEAPSDESGVDVPGKNIYINTNINSSFYTFNTDRYMTTADAWSIYDIAASVPFDAILVLVNSNIYGGGGFFNFYAESTVDNPYSNNVAIHEMGHSFAGLADEYVGSVNYSDFYNLKIEPWEPNITTNVNFSSKWKNMVRNGTPLPTPREAKFDSLVGMFEGAGYMAKNIYSPMMDCRMKSIDAPGFCAVCQAAITRMIRFYCDE